ncbi:hypothetical protein BJX62DRAFT_205656 [Aspergillus germanicus]
MLHPHKVEEFLPSGRALAEAPPELRSFRTVVPTPPQAKLNGASLCLVVIAGFQAKVAK